MADLFNEKAKDWDARPIPQQLSASIGPAIIEQIDLNNDMSVMDFGAGTGLLTAHIAPLVKNIAAVDISESMLEQLVAKPEFHGKVQAHCQNILEQPLDEKFDLIISAMAIHHVEDTALLLERFSDHLMPNAHVALADLDAEDGTFHPENIEGVYHLGFEREHFKTLLERAGFINVAFSTAYTVNKDSKSYPIFLVTAQKDS
jgi:2-polyprenyl-3-methyl-5-hydroxy-6-metoxy-1,4-benzoquinol methylase